MTERSAIAVIRARLPYIAPETLSQAWRSAMRIACDVPATEPLRARGATSLAQVAVEKKQPARAQGVSGRQRRAATAHASGVEPTQIRRWRPFE